MKASPAADDVLFRNIPIGLIDIMRPLWEKLNRAAVAYGHESVFPFYEKMGFYPRVTYLEY